MWDDPDAALARQQHRDAARRRQRERQIEDLIAAARVLIPEHGLGITLGRIAVHAGLSRHAARGLFNATTDLATALVRRAWRALIEQVAPREGATLEQVIAGLIEAIRADAPAHVVHRSLGCGVAEWQRQTLAHADQTLALAVMEALRSAMPGLSPDPVDRLGGRVLALARAAALAPEAPSAQQEAAVIAGMVRAYPAAAAAARQATARPRPAPQLRIVASRPHPPRAAEPAAAQTPAALPSVHDPPAGSA